MEHSRCGDSKREGAGESHETDNSRTIEVRSRPSSRASSGPSSASPGASSRRRRSTAGPPDRARLPAGRSGGIRMEFLRPTGTCSFEQSSRGYSPMVNPNPLGGSQDDSRSNLARYGHRSWGDGGALALDRHRSPKSTSVNVKLTPRVSAA